MILFLHCRWTDVEFVFLQKLAEYQSKIRELQTVEAGLRTQVTMYTEKYDEFQSALTKSNEVFGGFNDEMEKVCTIVMYYWKIGVIKSIGYKVFLFQN